MGDMQHEERIPQNSGSPKSSSFNADEPPMVFQCSQCNVIVGDSTAWVCVDDISRTITLKNITNAVMEDEKMKIASAGFDAGSTYYKMSCATCHEEIGRRYKGAVNHMDSARGMFTLFVDKLSSYQIGSYDRDVTDSNADMSDILSMAKVRDMNMQISRLGAIMQEISERLQMLEQGYMPQGGDDNMSVRSMSYPSSCVSVPQRLISPSPKPSRVFSECQIPHPQNSNNNAVFKIPNTRHSQQHSGYQDNHSSTVQSTYSHLEQFHKVDQQERSLGVDPEESFQSHTHNQVRNIHSNKVRQQRRNSLNFENVPQNFRRGLTATSNGMPRDFGANEQNRDNIGKREETADSNRASSTLQNKSKRKEAPQEDPLQAMMSRRCKRRV